MIFSQQQCRARGSCWFLQAMLLWVAVTLESCQACTNIGKTPTWEHFTSVLRAKERGTGPRRPFCSFTIEGDNCPRANDFKRVYKVEYYLDLSCSDFGGGTGDGCIIRCPHAGITVSPNALMDVFSFDLGGADDTFLVVGTGAEVFGSRVSFTNNGSLHPDVRGGAVRVHPFATLTLEAPLFQGNSAGQGGAIFNQGKLRIDGGQQIGNRARDGGAIYNMDQMSIEAVHFVDNTADEDGGALYAAAPSSLEVQNSLFSRNRATRGGGLFSRSRQDAIKSNTWMSNDASGIGPAVYLGEGTGSITHSNNKGCGNGVSISKRCNGIAGSPQEDCIEFDQACPPNNPPTSSSPTESPSSSPTESPSSSPTKSPSSSPTESPSSTPTESPSVSTKPSLAPSLAPSSNPSETPSISPTVSERPSLSPSVSPSYQPSLRGNSEPTD